MKIYLTYNTTDWLQYHYPQTIDETKIHIADCQADNKKSDENYLIHPIKTDTK